MRYANGEAVGRDEVQDLLRLAGIAVGQDPSRIGSHTLRIGGATAMYHALGDLQVVRRYGRWASDVFH
eukprot:6688818-Heterocapsa_arctica.AAC.1